ncbi:MAG: type II toxin-antitoxin system VapB family antitoxin [Actinobacteria bacterium]|nr:type II toxin-antitoxin system VapB family antitoxin [Actinomycetota bacterium]
MARTNIDIDEEACRRVMERFNLTTMKDAVNLALRTLAIEPMTLDEALAMEGTGWEGDLAAMRTTRT